MAVTMAAAAVGVGVRHAMGASLAGLRRAPYTPRSVNAVAVATTWRSITLARPFSTEAEEGGETPAPKKVKKVKGGKGGSGKKETSSSKAEAQARLREEPLTKEQLVLLYEEVEKAEKSVLSPYCFDAMC
jgi:hypothetical protein